MKQQIVFYVAFFGMIIVSYANEYKGQDKMTRLNSRDLETISAIVSQTSQNNKSQLYLIEPVIEFLQLRKFFVFGIAMLIFMRSQFAYIIRSYSDSVGQEEFRKWREDISLIKSTLEKIQKQLTRIEENRGDTSENISITKKNTSEIAVNLNTANDNVVNMNKDIREIIKSLSAVEEKIYKEEQSFNQYLKEQEITRALINDSMKKQDKKIDKVGKKYKTITEQLAGLNPQILGINNVLATMNNEIIQMRPIIQALQNGGAPVDGQVNQ